MSALLKLKLFIYAKMKVYSNESPSPLLSFLPTKEEDVLLWTVAIQQNKGPCRLGIINHLICWLRETLGGAGREGQGGRRSGLLYVSIP